MDWLDFTARLATAISTIAAALITLKAAQVKTRDSSPKNVGIIPAKEDKAENAQNLQPWIRIMSKRIMPALCLAIALLDTWTVGFSAHSSEPLSGFGATMLLHAALFIAFCFFFIKQP
jgi:heme A synthase